jgi:dihydropyrimidinase
MVFPGGIDAHVHMETPMGNDVYTCDSSETGTRSAAFGGTTTIIDFAQQFHNDSPKAALDRRLAAADPSAVWTTPSMSSSPTPTPAPGSHRT